MPDWNKGIIQEFREHGGEVGGQFASMPLLLLHHRGAKSGIERVNPVAYQRLDDDTVAIFASKGGSPTNPDWYHNLRANPQASVEIGTETYDVIARVAEGEERDRIWTTQKERSPGFAGYERKTSRQIPVIVLQRARAEANALG